MNATETALLPGLAPQAQTDAPAHLVHVAVLAPVPGPLTYLVPPGATIPQPGTRVLCPLGQREVTGVVLGTAPPGEAQKGVRPLSEILDQTPLWTPDLMETVRFAADYYLAPLGDVVRAALPPGLAPKTSRQWMVTPVGLLALDAPEAAGLTPQDAEALAALRDKPRSPVWLHKTLGISPGRLARLAARGLCEDEQALRGHGKAATVVTWSAVEPPAQPLPRGPALAAVDAVLRAQGPQTQEALAQRFLRVGPLLKKLLALGRVTAQEGPAVLEDPYASFPTPRAPAPEDLTQQQRSAVETLNSALDAKRFASFLLQGVTGSGKTEVYLQALAHARAQGRTVLILVPEIALTPSLAARFRGRVPGGLAVLHSALTPGQRLAAYDAARAGRVGAVLGARSAIFAPLPNLGLVVVDEEHDGSYKQEESPRYQARDLALVRARSAGAVCVLGSATPSLESVHGVRVGRLKHLRLTQRPQARPLPHVELVDLRRPKGAAARAKDQPAPPETPVTTGARVAILSRPLLDALTTTLEQGQQALIFLNRRGYSSAVLCPDCGAAISCPNCAVALTHHKPGRRALHEDEERPLGHLRCHYCDHREPVPDVCPACQSPTLTALGLGIQRVEAELAARFPNARLGRLDRDAVRHKGALEKVLQDFSAHALDILVGTQMLAKGHDYPGVTLVGVVAADMSLRLPDWRAAERTVQILTQVAGRAGRGDTPGRVLVQTYCPEHEALRCAAHHDVDTFAQGELQLREAMRYPPYARLCLLRAESRTESTALTLAQRAATLLTEAAHGVPGVEVLGPAPAPLSRLKEVWRFQVLLKAHTHQARARVLKLLRARLPAPTGDARLILDVDPGSVL